MNELDHLVTLPKKTKSLTEDLAILPSGDDVQKVIIQEADEKISEMRDVLLKQVRDPKNRGKGSVSIDLPYLYIDYAMHNMKKWTKLYGYVMKVRGKKLTIYPKNQKLPKERCDSCHKQIKSLAHMAFKLAILGSSFAGFIMVWAWLLTD